MSSDQTEQIIRCLRQVAAHRAARRADAELAKRVEAIKCFQHARFERSYAMWLSHPRYGAAARFFLADLYGPGDFTARDTEFERVVPALVRLFPSSIVNTVIDLVELHALSESLDSRMAMQLEPLALDWPAYASAWQLTGMPDERRRQIDLMLRVGEALDQYTRSTALRRALMLMRQPARLAGLASLQSFLERGFDTFASMRGAKGFLQAIAKCETALAADLFTVNPPTLCQSEPVFISAVSPEA
jgi:hypothetical protein